ncbi:hypothetical protein EYF80_032709 [Liparis tanakae]|uniref:Uncharacterized protein n=1 Tax=Liparis tanakae TaxID=230148 RepID=A0A4Z2GX04_9TELE|nr:hypothetical protein EYF80_032709 [Liparis tanakae]
MEQRRFWESMGPGLGGDICLKPNGGFTSSELLTAWSPDMDTVELIWRAKNGGSELHRISVRLMH